MTIPLRVYGLLLKFFPARFREEYGKPLEMQFRDEYCEADRLCSRIAFWVRTLWDLVRSIPAELLREARQDIRYSLTTFQRRPMVTVFALAALSLGIGATTGVFSVVNALLLRSLPFRAPEQLVEVWYPPASPLFPRSFLQWVRSSPYLEDVTAFHQAEMTLMRTSEGVRVKVAQTSANFFTLLGSAPQLGRGFLKLLGMDLGFRTERAVTLSVSLAGTGHDKTALSMGHYYREALARLRAAPGVESAGAVDFLPLVPNMFGAPAFTLDTGQEGKSALMISATPDYFRTMGTDMVYGRDFVPEDKSASNRVAVVNELFARGAGMGPSLLGRKISMFYSKTRTWLTIVGVVRSIRFSQDRPIQPQVYYARSYGAMMLVARVQGNPINYLAICRDAVRSVDAQVPVFNINTLDDRLSEALARPRLYTIAVLFFAGFALFLSTMGVFGLATYSVAQRTLEIGVRIAVGATAGRVRTLFLQQSMLPVGAGGVVGIAGSLALGRYLDHLLVAAGVQTYIPWPCILNL